MYRPAGYRDAACRLFARSPLRGRTRLLITLRSCKDVPQLCRSTVTLTPRHGCAPRIPAERKFDRIQNLLPPHDVCRHAAARGASAQHGADMRPERSRAFALPDAAGAAKINGTRARAAGTCAPASRLPGPAGRRRSPHLRAYAPHGLQTRADDINFQPDTNILYILSVGRADVKCFAPFVSPFPYPRRARRPPPYPRPRPVFSARRRASAG
jgi:hypothetical protein